MERTVFKKEKSQVVEVCFKQEIILRKMRSFDLDWRDWRTLPIAIKDFETQVRSEAIVSIEVTPCLFPKGGHLTTKSMMEELRLEGFRPLFFEEGLALAYEPAFTRFVRKMPTIFFGSRSKIDRARTLCVPFL